VGLAWDSSPVASQHSYGGLTSGLPVSSLLWLGSESYFICNELWSAIQSVPKSKNPINHSVVLALGESNNGRLKQIKSTPVVWQDHTEIYGVRNLFHRLMPLRRFGLYTKQRSVKKFFSNKLIICDFICWFSAKQTNSLVVHRSILRLRKDAFSVSNVKRV
jgi:hypothetical protein